MTNEQKEKIREQMHRLLDIALDTNGFEERCRETAGSLPTIFFEYSGHVNRLDVDIVPNGWLMDAGPQRENLFSRQLDPEAFTDSAIDTVEEKCKKALAPKSRTEVLRGDIERHTERLAKEEETIEDLKKQLQQLESGGEE